MREPRTGYEKRDHHAIGNRFRHVCKYFKPTSLSTGEKDRLGKIWQGPWLTVCCRTTSDRHGICSFSFQHCSTFNRLDESCLSLEANTFQTAYPHLHFFKYLASDLCRVKCSILGSQSKCTCPLSVQLCFYPQIDCIHLR